MTAATLSKTLLTSIPPQLVPRLKTLRLGGMQDTLPLRLTRPSSNASGTSSSSNCCSAMRSSDAQIAPWPRV